MTTPAQPSFTPGPWKWYKDLYGWSLRTPHSGQLIVLDVTPAKKGTIRFSDRGNRGGKCGGIMSAIGDYVGGATGKQGFFDVENADARLIAASPSLYAYAKAVAIRSRWQDERDSIGSTEWADRLREFENHLTSMGWVRGEASDPFLSNYRATALALAEGGGK